MISMSKLSMLLIGLLCLSSVLVTGQSAERANRNTLPFYGDSRPWTRWWWFASMIQKNDIADNLSWLKENGFGGVEIAWVYPLNRFNKNDTT